MTGSGLFISFDYTVTPEDVTEGAVLIATGSPTWVATRRRSQRVFRRIALVMFLVGVVGGVIAFAGPPAINGVPWFRLCGIALIFSVLAWLFSRGLSPGAQERAQRVLLKGAIDRGEMDALIGDVVFVEVNEAEVTWSTSLRSCRDSWEAISAVLVGPDHALLLDSPATGVLFPRRVFASDATFAGFIAAARERVDRTGASA